MGQDCLRPHVHFLNPYDNYVYNQPPSTIYLQLGRPVKQLQPNPRLQDAFYSSELLLDFSARRDSIELDRYGKRVNSVELPPLLVAIGPKPDPTPELADTLFGVLRRTDYRYFSFFTALKKKRYPHRILTSWSSLGDLGYFDDYTDPYSKLDSCEYVRRRRIYYSGP